MTKARATTSHRATTMHRATTKRGTSHSTTGQPKQVIKRGVLISFNPATYTASVLIPEATGTFLQNAPVATHLDGTSAQTNSLCMVLFFDEQNIGDAAVIAVYPNSTQGVPVPAPGRVVFVSGYQQINAQTINSGNTSTFTLTGGSSGIPAGALGVIYKAYFTSATVGAYIQLAPHGASDITAYESIGNIQVASASVNGCGLLQLDSNGKIDIKANTGNCTVTLYTHGYTF